MHVRPFLTNLGLCFYRYERGIGNKAQFYFTHNKDQVHQILLNFAHANKASDTD